METEKKICAETLSVTLEVWNSALPQYPLKIADLLDPTPIFIMEAILEIFTLLGMNKENILYGPPEQDENTVYYADLIPIMNVSRVLNHIMSRFSSNIEIKIFNIISPSAKKTQLIFRFLSNVSLFMVSQLEAMEPRVQEIYDHKKLVEAMEDEDSQLKNQMNEVAVSKACRGGRLKKVEEEQHSLNSELREITETNDKLKKKHQLHAKKNEDLYINLDHIHSQTDVVLMEISRIQAQIVNDADEIKYRYEQAILEERDYTEQRNQLQDQNLAKESTVKNLHNVKEKLEKNKNQLDEITTLASQLKAIGKGDCKDGDMAEQLSLEQLEKEMQEYSEQLEAAREKQRNLEEQRDQARRCTNNEMNEALNLKKNLEIEYKESFVQSEESEILAQRLQATTLLHEKERTDIMELFKQGDHQFNLKIAAYEDEIRSIVKDVVHKVRNKVEAFNDNIKPSSPDISPDQEL